jgi:hypothetical protein
MGIAKVMDPNLVTTAGGLRVFRHNGLLSNQKAQKTGSSAGHGTSSWGSSLRSPVL